MNNVNIKNKFKPTILFIVLFLLMLIFPYIPLEIFRIDLDKLSFNYKVLYNFMCDIGFMIILFMIYKNELIIKFKEYFKNFMENINTTFKYYLIGFLIMIISNIVIVLFFKNASANNEEAVRTLIDKAPLYMIFSVSIYAPFVEEIIFRKGIKDSVMAFSNNKFTKYLFILISGILFGSMHVIGSVTSVYDYLYIIPYSALGISFAALLYKTDNIFSTITIHSIHNTASIILYFMEGII